MHTHIQTHFHMTKLICAGSQKKTSGEKKFPNWLLLNENDRENPETLQFSFIIIKVFFLMETHCFLRFGHRQPDIMVGWSFWTHTMSMTIKLNDAKMFNSSDNLRRCRFSFWTNKSFTVSLSLPLSQWLPLFFLTESMQILTETGSYGKMTHSNFLTTHFAITCNFWLPKLLN